MALYRSKPVTVEAWRYPLDTEKTEFGNPPSWVHNALADGKIRPQPTCLVVTTNHGDTQCNPGDWIIRNRETGEIYPCNDATFHAKYEPAEDRVLKDPPYADRAERYGAK